MDNKNSFVAGLEFFARFRCLAGGRDAGHHPQPTIKVACERRQKKVHAYNWHQNCHRQLHRRGAFFAILETRTKIDNGRKLIATSAALTAWPESKRCSA